MLVKNTVFMASSIITSVGKLLAINTECPLHITMPMRIRIYTITTLINHTFGVSLTHGSVNHRSHIWTYVGSSDESTSDGHRRFKCPCINTSIQGFSVPVFMGNDYFCDTAISQHYISSTLFSNNQLDISDPLWDGKGCGPTNSCCNFPNDQIKPPWFYKHLSQGTTDDIEMRLCRPGSDGSTPIELVELYVQ